MQVSEQRTQQRSSGTYLFVHYSLHDIAAIYDEDGTGGLEEDEFAQVSGCVASLSWPFCTWCKCMVSVTVRGKLVYELLLAVACSLYGKCRFLDVRQRNLRCFK